VRLNVILDSNLHCSCQRTYIFVPRRTVAVAFTLAGTVTCVSDLISFGNCPLWSNLILWITGRIHSAVRLNVILDSNLHFSCPQTFIYVPSRTVDVAFALSGTVTCVSDLISFGNCPLLVKFNYQKHCSDLQCSATERGPWLKSSFFLSTNLHIRAPQDCGSGICDVGDRNMRFWPHILWELTTYGQIWYSNTLLGFAVQCDWTWSLTEIFIFLVNEPTNTCPAGLWTWHLRCRGP